MTTITQLQILKIAKRQLAIITSNFFFKLYQNKIIKAKSGNDHKFKSGENLIFYRETVKIRFLNKEIRFLKSAGTSRISLDVLKSSHIYITVRFIFEKVNPLDENEQIFEQCVQSKYNKSTKKYYKLIDIILNVEFLQKCYLSIKLKLGNSIPVTDKETLDGINKK